MTDDLPPDPWHVPAWERVPPPAATLDEEFLRRAREGPAWRSVEYDAQVYGAWFVISGLAGLVYDDLRDVRGHWTPGACRIHGCDCAGQAWPVDRRHYVVEHWRALRREFITDHPTDDRIAVDRTRDRWGRSSRRYHGRLLKLRRAFPLLVAEQPDYAVTSRHWRSLVRHIEDGWEVVSG